jgi:hypothetical protein
MQNKAITFEQDQGLSARLAKTGICKTAFGGAKIRHTKNYWAFCVKKNQNLQISDTLREPPVSVNRK